MRQLHSNPIAVSGSGLTGTPINSFDAVIHVQKSPPHKRFLVGFSSPFTRLAEHFTALRAWWWRCMLNTSRPFALGDGDVYVVGENPTCSGPAFLGMRGSMVIWSYDYGHA